VDINPHLWITERHKNSVECSEGMRNPLVASCNRTSIFSVTTKVHKNEHQYISQNAMVMNTLVQQKQQIDVLEAECSMLRNMVCNINKGFHSAASNLMMSVNSVQEGPRGRRHCPSNDGGYGSGQPEFSCLQHWTR
jgi:hypothetical protein